jgi:A/G-specific adenine glycosylase
MLPDRQKIEFRSALLAWYQHHKRDLPWRRTSDPYAIWISEIMLQQTRVAAVIPFYERFLKRFPDFHTLAAASESDLLAQWAGLGYYYRARNLQQAAMRMCEQGCFPSKYEAIREMPGVGEYTSAAVASIGFNLPFAAVDGNVLRVLSRVFADPRDIASGTGRRHFAALADELLEREQPGAFNQAMMELGATICLPKNPQCLLCPVAELCKSRHTGQQNQFPVKLGRNKSVQEERRLFWIEREEEILLWQRPDGSRLMPGFWELPELSQLPEVEPGDFLGDFRHSITFHDYRFSICEAKAPSEIGSCRWINLHSLKTLPVSTVFRKAQRAVKRGTAGRSGWLKRALN